MTRLDDDVQHGYGAGRRDDADRVSQNFALRLRAALGDFVNVRSG